MGWDWEKTTPWHSGSSGDLSKLFKNEPVKNPGVLAVNAPSDRATLLAREVIQNSWDAAIELQRTDDNAPQFEIEFEYRDLTGDARRAAMEAMDQIGRARVGKEWRSSGAAQRVTTEAGGEQ